MMSSKVKFDHFKGSILFLRPMFSLTYYWTILRRLVLGVVWLYLTLIYATAVFSLPLIQHDYII
jgi:hypothetical protein